MAEHDGRHSSSTSQSADAQSRRKVIDENKRAISEVVERVRDVVARSEPMPLGAGDDEERLREVAGKLEELAATANDSARLARHSIETLETLRRRREGASDGGGDVPAAASDSDSKTEERETSGGEDFNEATGRLSAGQRSRMKWIAGIAVSLAVVGFTAFYIQQKAQLILQIPLTSGVCRLRARFRRSLVARRRRCRILPVE